MADRFDLGCSHVVFESEQFTLLSQSGHRLQALLDGTAIPKDLGERYFIDCIQRDADYHSHQCLEAEAWRKMVERRQFERLNPPPAAGRTRVRPNELHPGVILTADPNRPLLITRGLGAEHRGRCGPRHEYRLAPQFPWRRPDDGWWRQVVNLRTGGLEEFPPTDQQTLEALDDPPRELLFVWQNDPNDEMLVTDANTGETFRVPPNQIAEGATWRVHPYTPVCVECWDGRPVWVWGAA